ncbi:sigma-70 family RNA polymerase sigma factor [Candidatus Acidulodesulfobacterium sp. H_13]|uniref:sigma-70 family RNA polymerase sigma factor n=1 Tax=Candidatus Acidulodesulfobacterium sp. H_13 TaxID=3395470 RepID=UPI003AF5F8AF
MNNMEKINQRSKKLIEENYNLINKVANFMMIKFNGMVNRDDLIDMGIGGLIDAAVKFDPSKNENFKFYAITRIKGSILDGVRKLDYMPRNVRELSGRIEKAYSKLEQKLGRMPADDEVAIELDATISEFNDMLYKIRGASFLSDKDFMFLDKTRLESLDSLESKDPSVIDNLLIDEKKNILQKCIDILGEIERNVLMMYYHDELTLKEIGDILSLTESRICQIHSKAIIKLRLKLKSYE